MSGGFNITNADPIDSRAYTTDITHIYLPENWEEFKPYAGLIVSDKKGEVRICVNDSQIIDDNTNKPIYCLESSWKKISGEDDFTITNKVTYNELKILRDNSQLVPGCRYQIIDYSTKTTAENTQSSLWNFDVIVEATSENSLSENAKVVRCYNTKRDYGDKIGTQFDQGFEDINNWKSHGASNGGPTLPQAITSLVNGRSIYTEVATRSVNSDTIVKVTLRGTYSNGNNIEGFGAALIQGTTIIDQDFGINRREYYLQAPTSGSYAIRFYALSGLDVSSLNNGYCGAKAESFSTTSHFENSNLEAWEIKYCLDNDTDRFAWADTTNGRGVIYYMKDEFNNEAPYDFKNIQFLRNQSVLESCYPSIASNYGTASGTATAINNRFKDIFGLSSDLNHYFYTFSSFENNESKDGSLLSSCHDNKIEKYVAENKIILNDTIFVTGTANLPYNNSIGNGSYRNMICGSGNITNNNISFNFKNNNFLGSFHNNVINNSCQNNAFANKQTDENGSTTYGSFYRNNIGVDFKYVFAINSEKSTTFGRNTTGVGFKDINISGNMAYNKFGDNFWRVKFGYNMSYCNFGSYIQYCSLINQSGYDFGYTEAKYNNYGSGWDGVDYIPVMQNVDFMDNMELAGSTQTIFSDLKCTDGTKLIDKVIPPHNSTLYVHKTNGLKSDTAQFEVRTAKSQMNYLDLGEVDNTGTAESQAASAEVVSNKNIFFIRYNVGPKTGIIQQFQDGAYNNVYYVTQYLYWDGYQHSRQITYTEDSDGVVTVGAIRAWYKMWNHNKDSNNAPNTVMYSRNSEVVNLGDEQTITAKKTFANGLSVKGKTYIDSNIDPGELKVFPQENNINKGFIIRSANRGDNIPTVEILGTNTQQSYNYQFPKKSGTVAMTSDLESKQNTLVSGNNIKTINGNDILGNGNIVIESGYVDANIQAINFGESVDDVEIDFALKDEIPTNVSQLNNDSGYVTSDELATAISQSITNALNTEV